MSEDVWSLPDEEVEWEGDERTKRDIEKELVMENGPDIWFKKATETEE
jgi:hypothetical protein